MLFESVHEILVLIVPLSKEGSTRAFATRVHKLVGVDKDSEQRFSTNSHSAEHMVVINSDSTIILPEDQEDSTFSF